MDLKIFLIFSFLKLTHQQRQEAAQVPILYFLNYP